jgi:hypothetical protein
MEGRELVTLNEVKGTMLDMVPFAARRVTICSSTPRIASTGLTRLARHAGTSAAAVATTSRRSATPPSVAGSVALIPKTRLLRSRDTASAPARPSPSPTVASSTDWRSTMRSTSPFAAPSDIRIPISWVRSATV